MPVWNCPACTTALSLKEKTWSCSNGHSYDVAKEGYVNLLLVQQKNSKQPGDNKEMVNGRRAFLEEGHYQPLAEAVASIFLSHLNGRKKNEETMFFDAGCGEGYYMNHVDSQTKQHFSGVQYSGIDISKFAIQKAARKYSNHQFAVASTFHLPVASSSCMAVLQIFSPSSNAEIHRILKKEGIWITVNPASNHLTEIKQTLYDKPSAHAKSKETPEGFTLVEQKYLRFNVELNQPSQRENLLMMTPYYWSATVEKKQKLVKKLTTVTADFDINVFVKSTM